MEPQAESTTTTSTGKRILTGVAALADGLVFLPVALTWFEIGRAFQHFGEIEGDREDFLTEWQGGFRGAGTTISDVAQHIAIAVVAIAILYVVLSFLERRGQVDVAVATSREGEHDADYAREMRSVLDRLPTLASSYVASSLPPGAVDIDGHRTSTDLSGSRDALRGLAASSKEQAEVLKQIRELLIEAQMSREGSL